MSKEKLIGKWASADNMVGFSFTNDGSVLMQAPDGRSMPLCWEVSGNKIVIIDPQTKHREELGFVLTGEELKVDFSGYSAILKKER